MAVPEVVATTKTRGIDEDLWFGNFSDEEAEKKAAESVAAMVGRIVGAKPFPIAAQRLAEVTRDPDCDLNDIIRILERDVALSTRLLRLVNSASFALRTPCTSVRQATGLVGTERLNQLATTAAILDMVDSSSVHASRILEHSSVVGALCRYLAVHLGLPQDELFTCGFLHDIGKLMLLETEGKRYVPLLEEVGLEYDAIHLYERELFGFDHALLAGHVLQRWAIPDPVPKVVAWHHHVTRAYDEGPRWASLTSVLRLADLLSYSLTAEKDEAEVERVARSESASYLDISAAQLAAVWDEMRTLQERSSALFRGEEPPEAPAPVSLRPSTRMSRTTSSRSIRAPILGSQAPAPRSRLDDPTAGLAAEGLFTAPASVRIQDAPDGPKQFPCVVCAGPSFANTCLACHGYVCPDHQSGAEGWCDLCWREYNVDSHNWRLRPILSLIMGAGIGATVVGGFFTAASGHSRGSLGLLIGPLVGTGIVAGLVAILHRYAQRAWFLKTRPDRSTEEGLADTAVGRQASSRTTSSNRIGTNPLTHGALDEKPASSKPGKDQTMPSHPPHEHHLHHQEGEAPLVAETRKFASRGYGMREPTPMRNALGLSAEVSISETSGVEGAWPASLAPPARQSNAPGAGTQSSAPNSSAAPIASVLPWADKGSQTERGIGGSLPPGASVAPGSKEAAERGRTLKLLSEHGSRREDEPKPTMAPSSSPEIVVQPMFGQSMNSFEREGWAHGAQDEQASEAPNGHSSVTPSSWSNPRASRELASLRAGSEPEARAASAAPAVRKSSEPGISVLAPARHSGAPSHSPRPMHSSRRPSTLSQAPVNGASVSPAKSASPTLDGIGMRAALEAASAMDDASRAAEAETAATPEETTAVSFSPERALEMASGPPTRGSRRPSASPSVNPSAPPASRRSVAPAKFPSVGAPPAVATAEETPRVVAPEAPPSEEPSFDDSVGDSSGPLESGIVPAEAPAAQVPAQSQAAPAAETSEAWRTLLDSTGTADGW